MDGLLYARLVLHYLPKSVSIALGRKATEMGGIIGGIVVGLLMFAI